jgi:crotonobetainyl-CoA:carnitine CoA-transferase CaiB-like acyl-CoA transferase
VESPPPRLGEHTAELLERLGYTGAQLAALRERGVV